MLGWELEPGYHRETELEPLEAARANHCLAPVMTSAGTLVEGSEDPGRSPDFPYGAAHAAPDLPRRRLYRKRRN